MLLALELNDRCDRGSAIMFLEEGCLKGLAWHALKVPCLHYALRAHDLAEFAVEAVFGAVRVNVGEMPSAAWADVHLFNRHLVFSRSHPLGEQFGIRVCAEHEVTRRLENSHYADFGITRCCDQRGLRGGLRNFHKHT